MLGYLMESVVLAFVLGGIFGAIAALHLQQPEAQEVRIHESERNRNH